MGFFCVVRKLVDDANGVPAAVAACMSEHDSAKRLACYDREVGRAVTSHAPVASSVGAPAMSSGSASASAPSDAPFAKPAPPAAPEPSPQDAFGMTAQLHKKETGGRQSPELDKLAAHIAAVAYKPRGEAIVTLDNGQVWEEAEASSHLDLHPGDEVTIRKGMLGAFYLSSRQVAGLRMKRTR
jgi:hypothetical protein